MRWDLKHKNYIYSAVIIFSALVMPVALLFTLPANTIEEYGVRYLFYKPTLFGVYFLLFIIMLFYYSPRNIYDNIKKIFPWVGSVSLFFIRLFFYLIVFIALYLSATSIYDIISLY
jgi:membrane protease YdiL (CAAX protease family)